MKPYVVDHFHLCIECGGRYFCRQVCLAQANRMFSKCSDCIYSSMDDGEYEASMEEQAIAKAEGRP